MISNNTQKELHNYKNRLIYEKSPYLLQHAHNPVDWYPWCSDAFEKAGKDNKLIFLSIGYSTCHWCHVMKRESFEDLGVAKLMNKAFVSIKVDREERPDIDNIYMTICQMISNNCGWPLNIIMTPSKKPFFASTYIPKQSRPGHIGMLELIPKIEEFWMTRPEEILNYAELITANLLKITDIQQGQILDKDTLKIAYDELAQRFDEVNGGFGEAPKFPIPHNFFFLLRYWRRIGDERALQMVDRSLQSMRNGGIFDQVGGGFHRYSTDSKWIIPHFEKMLYDQALLAMAYTEAFQVTKKSEFKQTVEEILTYVLREMVSSEGAFYSAEDAESEGEEGLYYLWKKEEINKILGEDTNFASKIFNLNGEGNFTNESSGQRLGVNILYFRKSISEIASDLGLSENEIEKKIKNIKQKLLNERKKRKPPHKDTKILTNLNGLMIAALSKATQILDEPKYLEAAKKAADFLTSKIHLSNGRLYHSYKDNEQYIYAYLDDYAFLIWGLIELYEATFNVDYLRSALELNNYLLKNFWDNERGGFYFSSDDSETILVRKKEIYDGAIPSGNSVQMLNLLRLSRITANIELEKKSIQICKSFSNIVKKSPSSFTQLMVALDFLLGPSYEVVIAGNSNADDTKNMLKVLRANYLPNKILLLNPTEEESPKIHKIVHHITKQPSIDGQATSYICTNYSCKEPTTDVKKMIKMLES
ncbi:thioredoxin domain-containing protein [[Eubacterium] cellulosolvens]